MRISLYILYQIVFVTILCFLGTPEWKPGRVTFGCLRLLCNNKCFNMFVEDPFCTKCDKQPNATFWQRIFPSMLYQIVFVILLHFVGAPKRTPGRTKACFGAALHHFWSQSMFWSNDPSLLLQKLVLEQPSITFGVKACFGATLYHFWSKSLFWSNTQY